MRRAADTRIPLSLNFRANPCTCQANMMSQPCSPHAHHRGNGDERAPPSRQELTDSITYFIPYLANVLRENTCRQCILEMDRFFPLPLDIPGIGDGMVVNVSLKPFLSGVPCPAELSRLKKSSPCEQGEVFLAISTKAGSFR